MIIAMVATSTGWHDMSAFVGTKYLNGNSSFVGLHWFAR